MPAFALTLGLFDRKQRRPSAEHLVFGLHCQTFVLFILLLVARLPSVVADASSHSVIAYFVIALKRVYGGTWVEAASRLALILGLYFSPSSSRRISCWSSRSWRSDASRWWMMSGV